MITTATRSLLLALLLLAPITALAGALPATIDPPQPFPSIVTDAPTISFVAPGVSYGDYEVWTLEGPLSIHVLAVNLHDPSVRLDTALASDRLNSNGETVSAMAARTGAVAGVNGDYFDINNTNAPLNILVEGGRLLKTPMHRYAFGLTRDKQPEFLEFGFGGNVQFASGTTVDLNGVNDWPPPSGGTSLLTPEFGDVPPEQNLTLVRLQPTSGSPPFSSYRIAGIADNTTRQPAGYYLGIGVNAYGNAGAIDPGGTIAVTANATPPLADLLAAVGGGPLLVRDGAPYDDPDGPSGGEFNTRIPSSGLALTRDGTLLMLVVDGRQPTLSIGLSRAQFASLMLGFGAVTGMALDGGGSSTMVARALGDSRAIVQNSPSDGSERRIGDALLVYSDAPQGPPARLAVAPQFVRVFAGAQIDLRDTTTDAAGHPLPPVGTLEIRAIPADLGKIVGQRFIAGTQARTGILHVTRGSLRTDVPVHVVDAAARIELIPKDPNVSPGERVRLAARAYDAQGYPLELPAHLQWSASSGRVDSDGSFVAGARDATVSVRVADSVASERVTVGQHDAPLQLGGLVHFATIPRNGPGSLDFGTPCAACVTLHYDFTGTERAAYLEGSVPLPKQSLGLAFDVDGDGNGEVLRVALLNAINERVALTAGKITWNGWRHVVVKLPASLAQPVRLAQIYVVNALGGPPVSAAGAISLRDVRTILAGSGDSSRQ
ncbi:MAG TPA: phosphodiester glycosidase family protein [Candidatus Baltobacteraceae bacterium]